MNRDIVSVYKCTSHTMIAQCINIYLKYYEEMQTTTFFTHQIFIRSRSSLSNIVGFVTDKLEYAEETKYFPKRNPT